jgi:hypothetical protein
MQPVPPAYTDTGQEHNETRKPAEKFYDGPVHVSIWENSGTKGAFRTASFQLRYRDQNKEWQTGHSYSAGDLKHLEKAATEARARIERWQQEQKAAGGPTRDVA